MAKNRTSAKWSPPEEFDEYKILRPIGRGSMGSVFLARDRLLDRPVAIKFASLHASDPLARKRFLVEARAVARIQHPNILAIHRIGEYQGRPYIVTEYLRGTSLRSLSFPQPIEDALSIIIDLCRGLSAAHRQGVLHRDIKPGNAFVCTDGAAKLLDFGLAKFEDIADPTPPQTVREKDLPKRRSNAGETHPPTAEDSWRHPEYQLTQPGTIMGTPHYMAPELWQEQPASRASDVYAMGVLMRVLLVGSPPYATYRVIELVHQSEVGWDVAPAASLAPDLPPRIAAIIDRCLAKDPEMRFPSGDALRDALEALQGTPQHPLQLTGNPYRGLQAFEAKHQDLFFGRGLETRTLVDRLRSESLVVVAGDSGVGKSSLCRAGVAPHIIAGELDPQRTWRVVLVIPGRRPLQSLVAALASSLDFPDASLHSLISSNQAAVAWYIRKKLGEHHGRLLLIDQLEELVTIADSNEMQVVGKVLSRLVYGVPGLRLLATVRGDFLTRVAGIPAFGDELMRALYILRPLSQDALRKAITGPASSQGVHFTEKLIRELVDAGYKGSLPLLQFALAELWEIHGDAPIPIGHADLEQIGGVEGALSRHADNVVATMLPAQRIAARKLLMQLVSSERTRTRLSAEELTAGDPDMEVALEALVRGRLLVTRETDAGPVFEIAHEALIHGWGTLTNWLKQQQAQRMSRFMLERAATEWDKQGRLSEMLWGPAQLQSAQVVEHLRPLERRFLRASQIHVQRGRRLKRWLIAGIPILVFGTFAVLQLWQYQVDVEAYENRLVEASHQIEALHRNEEALNELREKSYGLFDQGDAEAGSSSWQNVEKQELKLAAELSDLNQFLTTTRELDTKDLRVRALLAEMFYARARLAEQLEQPLQIREFYRSMKMHDHDGSQTAKWEATAELKLQVVPAEAVITVEQYIEDADGRMFPTVIAGPTSPIPFTLPPGSYRLRIAHPGFAEVLAPVVLSRAEHYTLAIELPLADAIPAGFRYVPEGRFLYGSSDRTLWNRFFDTVPIHTVETDSYLIARHETTIAQWIHFLESLPEEQRAQHLPGSSDDTRALQLNQIRPGQWQLRIVANDRDYVANSGELIQYQGQGRIGQPWEKLPITNIVSTSIQAYVEWLVRTNSVPGAHLCTEYEWERAARGADNRLYPHGNTVRPGDFHYDISYSDGLSPGPDAAGSYPTSESPFGVMDMSGNAYELVTRSEGGYPDVARGGAWFYDELMTTTVNRATLTSKLRLPTLGFRVCGRLPPT